MSKYLSIEFDDSFNSEEMNYITEYFQYIGCSEGESIAKRSKNPIELCLKAEKKRGNILKNEDSFMKDKKKMYELECTLDYMKDYIFQKVIDIYTEKKQVN